MNDCSPGKTAAFMLPVLERLVYKPRTSQVTRVLVLVPTRELGIQVHSVSRQLAQFTSITTCLAVGKTSDTNPPNTMFTASLQLVRVAVTGTFVSRWIGPKVSGGGLEGGARRFNSYTRQAD